MLTPGTRLGPYEIASPLGAGGMGEVFRARDTKLNRDIAIKVLPAAFAQDSERVARFRREALLLASLNHPNVAAIHGLDEMKLEVITRARCGMTKKRHVDLEITYRDGPRGGAVSGDDLLEFVKLDPAGRDALRLDLGAPTAWCGSRWASRAVSCEISRPGSPSREGGCGSRT